MIYFLIIYLVVFLICFVCGLISGISVYRDPSGHKFSCHHEIFAGIMMGVLSPILIPIGILVSIGGLIEHIKNKKKNEKVQGENN